MLPSSHRLRHSSDVRATLRGASAGSKVVIVHVALREMDPATADLITGPRVGVVCSKAVGNSVIRHTLARRLRHCARDVVAGLPRNSDLVIRARPAAVHATHDALSEAIAYCTRKAHAAAERRRTR
ncbi:ribonuclease P protein component [Corynebacterium kroppenstedtii]|uniref:ribonuclease P protein component n=1 Tax=Corynebacterium sp. PCR 32 TaxID=3351342 RepID=UPI0030AFB91D